MGRPYSLDLRERVVTAVAAGMSGQQAAQHFSVGESSALRWARRARETGSPEAKPMGGTRPFALEAYRRWIIVRLARHHVMLSAVPSSGKVNTVISITGIGDHDRPEWLIRINGMRTTCPLAVAGGVAGGWQSSDRISCTSAVRSRRRRRCPARPGAIRRRAG